MSKLNTLGELLIHNVKDLYSAETQLVKALPKMAKAANDADLKKGFEDHLEETKVHVTRLEQVAELLGASPRGLSCKAMKGLVEEGEEAIKEEAEEHIKDLALIAAAQKVEHYEISGYGTARALAEAIGNKEVAELLKTTEDEEGATDKKLTAAAKTITASAPAEA
ncbi:ferritin-like domain-containing protein [Luteolibacter sp. SL250]|uniref:YciE/YciF ferroxidase family protein n=1 Tax=Luteolibacter sp. SL250 TaxID=2995170 RepID=UPI002270F7B4|nr:ferritin-like domain-containing protein [Luteolibacter sp. SL250]WAC18764.1 ferritin-like domain-containing protein [Luteolibacter sp. SL250]